MEETWRVFTKMGTAGVLLAGFSACALATFDASRRAELLLSDRPAPRGRNCYVAAVPETLPTADRLVDSAALAAALDTALVRDSRENYAIVSLAYDQNGWNERREVIETDLPPADVDSLQAAVFRHLREVAPGEEWGARLRIDLDPERPPRFRVGRQERCEARLLAGADLAVESAWDASRSGAPPDPGGLVRVEMLVDTDGTVAAARIPIAPARTRAERSLLMALQSLRFEPALVDGVPVRSLVLLRVPLPPEPPPRG